MEKALLELLASIARRVFKFLTSISFAEPLTEISKLCSMPLQNAETVFCFHMRKKGVQDFIVKGISPNRLKTRKKLPILTAMRVRHFHRMHPALFVARVS